jgi:hypothetical protein
MSQDLSAVGCVGHEQPAPQANCQIPPSDEVTIKKGAEPDCRLLPAEETSASEATSAVSNEVLHAEDFGAPLSRAGLVEVPEIRAPRRDEMLVAGVLQESRGVRVAPMAGALITTLGIGFLGGWNYYGLLDYVGRELSGKSAIPTVVERIIQAESNGCANTKNKRSTATGAGQFLDETWLRLIRAHRPELARRSEREVLELRRDPQLAREITARLAQQNAARLRQRGFSVTPGTLYLSHFAGSAGAVAILSAPESADAASIMASADATGRITREKIVPFLQQFTVADLKSWADRKMDTQQVSQSCGVPQQSGSAGRAGSSRAGQELQRVRI